MDYTLNVHGQLLDLSRPLVMGILNATPDSFYADSRQQWYADVVAQIAGRNIFDSTFSFVFD